MRSPRRFIAIAACGVALVACSSSTTSSGSTSGDTATSSALEARTTAANVPLLDQEAFDTHIHTRLKVTVAGKPFEVPSGIGIDEDSNRIAALHTHDATGEIHVESPKQNAKYTLDQFLTVWGIPADDAGRCTFFTATAPCTLTVTSKDSGKVGLDVILVDEDTLTLAVTST